MIAFIWRDLVIPLWAFHHALVLLVLGAFLMQFMVQGAWGVIPAHINELSPDNVRGFLPGFAYQCGVLIAAPIDWIEPSLAEHMGYGKAMAVMAMIIFACAATIAAGGREKKGIAFGNVMSPDVSGLGRGFPLD